LSDSSNIKRGGAVDPLASLAIVWPMTLKSQLCVSDLDLRDVVCVF